MSSMDRTDEDRAALTPASFLAIMEPLVRDGNPYAGAYTLRMLRAKGDPSAEQAVVDDFTQAAAKMIEVFNRMAATITAAFGVINVAELAERLASVTPDQDDDDQGDYDLAPEGCWATSPHDDDEACNVPAVDALGLCHEHRLALA